MSEYIVFCNTCNKPHDVKYFSRFEKINKNTYRCKYCILHDKTRVCPKCFKEIIHQSPSAKRKAEELNSVCKNCCSNQIPQSFTEEQESFLIGLLLGDASIVYPSEKSLFPRLTLSRKEEDKDYLFWQFDVFKEFYGAAPTRKRCFDKRFNKEYFQYHLQSKTGKTFEDIFNMWYPNGIKIIPKGTKLNPLILLIWFLDDGSVINSSKNGLTLKLSTHGFNKEDVDFLANLLSSYLEDTFHVYRSDSGYIIKASTLPTIKFIRKIESIFPDFMMRKKTWINFDFNYVDNNITLFG